MTPSRRTATVAGALYLLTHVTSVLALVLYGPALDHRDYVIGSGGVTRVLVGGFLEVILALAVVGTAVTLYPVVKRHGEGLALGYVGLRVLEAAVIIPGVVSLLAVVTLRRQAGTVTGPDADSLVLLGRGLVAVHDWTFLIGPGLVCGTNTVVMASLMYRSRLVPRVIAGLGIVGGPVVFASNTAVLAGVYGQKSAGAVIGAIPVFAWEVSLAIYLIVKGFRAAPPAALRDGGRAERLERGHGRPVAAAVDGH